MSVFIAKENNDTKQAIRRIVEHFKDKLDLSKGVFLKPNIVFPVREKSGEITRHKVVRALIDVLREINPEVDIIIGEGTAAGTDPLENFKISGYSKLAKDLNVPLLNLDEVERKKLGWKYGILRLPKIAFERTYINLAILKPSSAAGISGAMKNQKGLLEPKVKKAFHKLGLHEPIAHLNKSVQPDLTIMDGINFFTENVLIAGNSTYEIDRMAAGLLGVVEPDYLKISKKIGLESDEMPIFGDNAKDLETPVIHQAGKYKQFLGIRLWSNPRACSMCRYTFLQIKKFPMDDLRYTSMMYLKLLKYAIKGVEIILGSRPQFVAKYQKIVCIGDCTKRVAEKNGYVHVPGCPPTKDEMIKYL